MIYKNGKLTLEIQQEIQEIINGVQGTKQQRFGAIYHGAKLVWLTVYNAVKSCFGSGLWYGDKLWLSDDTWKTN